MKNQVEAQIERKEGSKPVLYPSWVPPVMTVLELFVYFAAFFPAAICIKRIATASNPFLITALAVAGFFSFQLTLIFASALLARCFPVPSTGRYQMRDPRLNSLWVRESLSNLCYRTFVHGLANFFPFPGHLYYKLLGAKIDPSVHFDYKVRIMNPYYVSIGKMTELGTSAVVLGHIGPNVNTFILGRVSIGDRVMIGTHATISPDVVIGNDAVICSHSFVGPGTRIPAGEMWGGVPAKFMKKIAATSAMPENLDARQCYPARGGVQPSSLIQSFIETKKGSELTKAITSTTPLFSSGLLDSLDFQELVSFLEKNLNIDLSTKSVSMDSMDTIEQISNLVSSPKNINPLSFPHALGGNPVPFINGSGSPIKTFGDDKKNEKEDKKNKK